MTPKDLRQQLEEQAEDILANELATCRKGVEDDLKSWLREHEEEEASKYNQIHEQLTEVQQQLKQIHDLFEQGKGALIVLKWVGYSAMAVWALLVWAKDHLKI